MPLNGNTYVAPTWRNGQPPALDPTELQAISDTLAAAQSKNVSQDSLIAALQTAVGGKAQIEVGSYVGTGTYGASNPCSITCSFAPKFMVIGTSNLYGFGVLNQWAYGFIWIKDVSKVLLNDPSGSSGIVNCTVSVNDKTISWYNDKTPENQLNGKNLYQYFIILG